MKISDAQLVHIHDNGLSVKDAAEKAGCSESTVRKYRKQAEQNVDALEAQLIEAGVLVTEAQRTGAGEQDDTTGDVVDTTFIDDAENLTIPAEGAVEAFVASYQQSRCGHVTTGGARMCGLAKDHKARNIGHCYGTPVPV